MARRWLAKRCKQHEQPSHPHLLPPHRIHPPDGDQLFKKNLRAKLARSEMTTMWDTSNIVKVLEPAIEAGFIAYSDGFYTAGDDIDQAPNYGSVAQADATIAQARNSPLNAFGAPVKPQADAPPPKPEPKAKQALPDPATIALDDNVPLTDGKRRAVDWDALLKRMQPSQSCLLPKAAKSTLTKAVTAWHKSTNQKFVVSKVSETEIRIWRTV